MIKRIPLIWQLFPSFLILVLIAVLATGWFASRAMHDFYLDQCQQDLIERIHIMMPQIQPHLDPLNAAALDRYCKQIALEIPMRLTVLLPDGKPVGDSEADPGRMENHLDRPEVRQAMLGQIGSAHRFSETINRRMMYVALPVGRQPVRAVVRLALPLTAIEEHLLSLRGRLVVGGLAIGLAAALVCLAISRRITRPIEAMRASAARFAQGELSHRLVAPATQELAGLAQAMNQMAQELEQRLQAILRQRNESEAVLSSMLEAVVALDPDEHILHLNGAAARLLGTDEKQLQGRSIQEVVRNRELHEMIRTTLDQGVAAQADVVLYRPGEQVLNARSMPLFDADGRRMGALLVANDVTQMRRLETMRTDFAANVSHEIKTPLTAIQGFVETLAQGAVTDPQEAQRFLGIIDKHVKRLTAIVDDLMQLARLEQGDESRQLRLEKTAVAKVVRTAAQLCRSQAEAKAMRIDIQCAPELEARLDAELMEQALVNLLDNAIKYSPEKSRIAVTVAAVSEEIRIAVADEGIGVAPAHLPRLFERFYRVDKSRSRRMGGTGLGLAIVKHIVQAHGGQVTVTSVQGKGSTFTIHMPRRA
jgi:two-component system phosphate regulon sensor histidine kinase PhoR